MAIAGFQHQALQALAARQGHDLIDDHRANLAATMRGPRIHALDLADAVRMPLQRAARHCLAGLAGDEHGRIGPGHLLGGHVEHELRRRQLQQGRVQLGDQGADVVLQRAFDGDGDAVHRLLLLAFCRQAAGGAP